MDAEPQSLSVEFDSCIEVNRTDGDVMEAGWRGGGLHGWTLQFLLLKQCICAWLDCMGAECRPGLDPRSNQSDRITWLNANRSSRADAVEKPVVVRHHLHPE